MILIIPKTIQRKELSPIAATFPRASILQAAQKIAHGLGTGIGKINGSLLVKLSLTSSGGAGRSIWAVRALTGEIVILLVRKKSDKVGENMTIKNPLFVDALHRALDHLSKDAQKGDLEIIDLGF